MTGRVARLSLCFAYPLFIQIYTNLIQGSAQSRGRFAATDQSGTWSADTLAALVAGEPATIRQPPDKSLQSSAPSRSNNLRLFDSFALKRCLMSHDFESAPYHQESIPNHLFQLSLCTVNVSCKRLDLTMKSAYHLTAQLRHHVCTGASLLAESQVLVELCQLQVRACALVETTEAKLNTQHKIRLL